MTALYPVLCVVALQRVGELLLAARNTRWLRAAGAVEIDRQGYPWIVLLHAAWLFALAALVPSAAIPSWPLLALFAALQIVRVWVIASLGRRWTTRLIVVPTGPLVTSGPFRWLRHPNYAVVTAEILVLPLAFGAIGLALVFTAANLILLARRVALEERALAPYRAA